MSERALAYLEMLAAALAIAALTIALMGCGPITLEQEVTYRSEEVPGTPLDAIRYNGPSFADGRYSWRVTDRQSGSQWWLVWMNTGRKVGEGQWLVLPVEGAKGAA